MSISDSKSLNNGKGMQFHDKTFLQVKRAEPGIMIICDTAYCDYFMRCKSFEDILLFAKVFVSH